MYDIQKISELVFEVVDEIYLHKDEPSQNLGNALLPIIQKIIKELGVES